MTAPGMSETIVSSPPASRRRTFHPPTSVNRFATTEPAEPAPMIIKSYELEKDWNTREKNNYFDIDFRPYTKFGELKPLKIDTN